MEYALRWAPATAGPGAVGGRGPCEHSLGQGVLLGCAAVLQGGQPGELSAGLGGHQQLPLQVVPQHLRGGRQ